MLRKLIIGIGAAVALALALGAVNSAHAAVGWVGATQACSASAKGTVDVTFKMIGVNPYAPTYVDISGANNGWAPGTFTTVSVNAGVSSVTVSSIPGNSLIYVRVNQPDYAGWDATETFYLVTDGHCVPPYAMSSGAISYSTPSVSGGYAPGAGGYAPSAGAYAPGYYGQYGAYANQGSGNELDRFARRAVAATYGPHPPGHPLIVTYPGIIPGVGWAPGSTNGITCETSYASFCLPIDYADLSCLDLFIFEFVVTGDDPHDFDLDDDGVGCTADDILLDV